MLAILIVCVVVFGCLAWLVAEPTVKKVSLVLFVICAITLVVLILLQAVGSSPLVLNW